MWRKVAEGGAFAIALQGYREEAKKDAELRFSLARLHYESELKRLTAERDTARQELADTRNMLADSNKALESALARVRVLEAQVSIAQKHLDGSSEKVQFDYDQTVHEAHLRIAELEAALANRDALGAPYLHQRIDRLEAELAEERKRGEANARLRDEVKEILREAAVIGGLPARTDFIEALRAALAEPKKGEG